MEHNLDMLQDICVPCSAHALRWTVEQLAACTFFVPISIQGFYKCYAMLAGLLARVATLYSNDRVPRTDPRAHVRVTRRPRSHGPDISTIPRTPARATTPATRRCSTCKMLARISRMRVSPQKVLRAGMGTRGRVRLHALMGCVNAQPT